MADRWPMTRDAMELIAETRHHRGQALVCEEDAKTAAVLKRSIAISELVVHIDELVTRSYDMYVEFRMWQCKVEKRWTEDPDSYNPEVQVQVEHLHAQWLEIFKLLVCLMDWAEGHGQGLRRGKEIREQYAVMLSVEAMDFGPVPPHMVELTKRARAAFDAGVGIETVGSGGF